MHKPTESVRYDRPVMLNLGCGTRVHPDWINLDYSRLNSFKASLAGRVLTKLNILSLLPQNYQNHDLRTGIPHETNTVSFVYCCHVLEHIDRAYLRTFIAEVFRVLRPGGVFRVIVPDLEKLAKEYLRALEAGKGKLVESVDAAEQYDLTMLELFDQMVRTELGGEKRKLALGRQGNQRTGLGQRLKHLVVKVLLPSDPAKTGELHRWMYDEYSLDRLLRAAGFFSTKKVSYDKSDIPGFENYYLDNNRNGSEYKPDSLYMEATKPPATQVGVQ